MDFTVVRARSLGPDLALENVTLFPGFRKPIHLLFQKFGDREDPCCTLFRSNNNLS